MIIVSQDKKSIVIIDNVTTIWIENPEENDSEKFSIEASAEVDKCLGYYETEERAKEVLKSIKAAYQSNKILECSESISQNIIAEKFLEVGMIPFEYNMPEK